MDDERVVSTTEAKTYAEKHSLIFMETSAKTGQNINEIFNVNEMKPIWPVREIVRKNWKDFESFPENLKGDRDVALSAIRENGLILKFVSEELKNDKSLVLDAVNNQGIALQFASMSLRADREVVITAVKNNGLALQFATMENRLDEEIIRMASEKKLDPKQDLLQYMKRDLISFTDIPIEFRNNKDILIEIISSFIKLYNNNMTIYHQDISKFLSLYKRHLTTSLVNSILEYPNPHPIVCYDLFHDSISALNTKNSEEIRNWGRKCRGTLTWAQYIPDLLQYLSKNHVPTIDLELALYFPNYRPKSSFTFKRTYSKEMSIELHLLKEISNHIVKFKSEVQLDCPCYHSNYYFLLDFIQKNIIDNAVEVKFQNITNINSSSYMVNITEIFNKQCMDAFISNWISLQDFPRFSSILELLQQDKGRYSEDRKYASIIHSKFPHYIPVSILGNGAQGIVFECYHVNESKTVAFKLNFQYDDTRDKEINELLMKNIDGIIHCYECNTFEYYSDKKIKCIIMEKGESIKPLLRNIYKNNRKLDNQSLLRILQIFVQILQAVNNLHNHNFVHRDLKLANMVLVGDTVKIIDLDSSRVIMTNKSCTLNVGTLKYIAPELYHDSDGRIEENFEISKQCDMFSLGCILLEMLIDQPLMLDCAYCNQDEMEDDPTMEHFTDRNGLFFHQAVGTQYLQHKLHHAIKMQIDRTIKCSSLEINRILSRMIVTMIQQNPNNRGNCAMYIQLFKEVILSMDNDQPLILPETLTKNLLDFNKNIIRLLKEENLDLKTRNEQLEKELIKLREELLLLKSKE